VVLAIYRATIAPTTQFWDASEYIAAAYVVGIPHPPGNPLFVIMAHIWGAIVPVASYALRINLFAAVTSALASGFLFLVAERYLRQVIEQPRWARLGAAFAGVLVGATSFTVWYQSVANEKVYTLSLFSIAFVLWLTVRRADLPDEGRRLHWLLLIAYLLALSATNHLMGLLVAPVVLAYLVVDEPRVFTRWKVWLGMLVVVAVGLSVFAVLPIRAVHFPPINEGEPTTWEALRAVLAREQYAKPSVFDRQADLLWQYGNYLQYFTWQFAHDLGATLRRGAAIVFGGLGLFGAVRQWQRDRRGALAMTLLMLTTTVVLVFYLNFKYGFSVRPDDALVREVRERDYFFVASFQLWGIWVALGFGAVLEIVSRRLAVRVPRERVWVATAPLLLFALFPLWGNHLTASRAGETLPRDFAYDLLQSVEPYGILVTAGDNDTFPLWYAQEVEGIRRDVLVVNLSLGNTLWHVRQLNRRSIIPFDSANAIALYRDRSWPAPTGQPLDLTMEAIDALPPGLPVSTRRLFEAGGIRAVLEPQVLARADLLVLRLIRDNVGKRPIYFSRTTGGYADNLGFTPYLLGQGLARKLASDTVRGSDDVVRMRMPLRWVDLPRTETLLFDVYHREAVARERPRGWIDRPSEGIMSLYGLLYAGYAEFVGQRLQDAGGMPDTAAARVAEASELAARIFGQTSFGQ
jgi:hypothetical protein